MKVQPVRQSAIRPMFIETKDNDHTYVNINNIASIHRISDNYWIAEGRSKDCTGSPKTYYFNDEGAFHIINYEA